MIKFRFHRGGLKESLDTTRTFDNMEQLLCFLSSYFTVLDGVPAIRVSDIVIEDDPRHDKRIGWKDFRWVCVNCWYGVPLDHPHPIGCVATEFCEPTDLSWQG